MIVTLTIVLTVMTLVAAKVSVTSASSGTE
jgi:hypothetical protein